MSKIIAKVIPASRIVSFNNSNQNYFFRRDIMFCYQCEQAANGKACTKAGVCGKDPQVAALQDLLVHSLKGLSLYANAAGKADREVNVFTVKALFSTLTNVDFDPQRFVTLIHKSVELRERIRGGPEFLPSERELQTRSEP